ncbi:hypothetical protein LMH87_004779 [Akanthomyces muscarius]|uniref:NmrA-like domain-containing protein n=1 Tax=Akanthomyces muscarius TaxID=2231603 RepID=A0A9W8UI02_AKAMU|nr:hypothetical protein LMH87_004779 [Akanthomyces muscarius]KAJ4145948.1 hypothetical protein LMH87_004779 [Akanthomyces muscarius]
MSRAILVTGATGKQGGAVIAALLAQKASFQMLALTRDSSSASARRLASQSPNITLIEGNLDDARSVFEKAKKATSAPIWGVFSVQSPPMNKTGPTIEEKQGRDLVDAALANNVSHFVYSSVDRHGAKSATNPTDIPHFISKHNIEQHLMRKAAGTSMRWTILRPVAFMDNFDGSLVSRVFATCWKQFLPSRPLQLVATADIGVFAAKAFADPAAWSGRGISLAGDELTFEQMSAVFRQKTGAEAPLSWGVLARMALWASREMSTMFAFFEDEGYGADIEEVRKLHPELKTMGAWLESSVFVKKA